jgi:c-di-GMP-binding flagellar brake protein YcgR
MAARSLMEGFHVPASRSRTERWRECLQQVLQRGGTLEVSLDRGRDTPEHMPDLVWRVHLFEIREDEIVVERPIAMGRAVNMSPGARLIGAMSIGQNRWMFHTKVLEISADTTRRSPVMRLAPPERVERCQRRSFYRISSATLRLPSVECWPLLDPTTVIAAEVANRAQIADAAGEAPTHMDVPAPDPMVLPEVGPRFRAQLLNIGGGGAGLLVEQSEGAALERCRMLWLRIDLRPEVPAPIGLTARLAHSRMDSGQNVNAGVAFDFAFHPAHKEFVVEQICRYVARTQARLSEAA